MFYQCLGCLHLPLSFSAAHSADSLVRMPGIKDNYVVLLVGIVSILAVQCLMPLEKEGCFPSRQAFKRKLPELWKGNKVYQLSKMRAVTIFRCQPIGLTKFIGLIVPSDLWRWKRFAHGVLKCRTSSAV